MESFLENIKSGNNLHHFYILEGDSEKNSQSLISFLEKELEYGTHSNPLFLNIQRDKLLIGDAKDIGRRAVMKTPKGEKMIFLVSCNSITTEAQNSLLKVVEEPPYETYFFFNVPRADMFLPTVISRAIIVKKKVEEKSNLLSELQSMNSGEKISWSDSLAKDISDEKISRGEVRQKIDSLIIQIHDQLPNHPKYAETLKVLQKVSFYMSLNGASMKILLNRVALAI